MTPLLELGIDTFGDVTCEPDGSLTPHGQVIRNLVDEAVLADQLAVFLQRAELALLRVMLGRFARRCHPRGHVRVLRIGEDEILARRFSEDAGDLDVE